MLHLSGNIALVGNCSRGRADDHSRCAAFGALETHQSLTDPQVEGIARELLSPTRLIKSGRE